MVSTVVASSSAPPSSPAPSSGNGDPKSGDVGTDGVTLPVKGVIDLLLERYIGQAADGSNGPAVRLSGEAFPTAVRVTISTAE